jgi:hypothetical protein
MIRCIVFISYHVKCHYLRYNRFLSTQIDPNKKVLCGILLVRLLISTLNVQSLRAKCNFWLCGQNRNHEPVRKYLEMEGGAGEVILIIYLQRFKIERHVITEPCVSNSVFLPTPYLFGID